jgi:hypothetical protein
MMVASTCSTLSIHRLGPPIWAATIESFSLAHAFHHYGNGWGVHHGTESTYYDLFFPNYKQKCYTSCYKMAAD